MTGYKPTHAGMVCFNRAGQVLICNGKGKTNEWVLPKGHIEPGEYSYEAAQREVAEETGIDTLVDPSDTLAVTTLEYQGEQLVIEWWAGLGCKPLPNVTVERASKWVSWSRALQLLTFEEHKVVLKAALAFR